MGGYKSIIGKRVRSRGEAAQRTEAAFGDSCASRVRHWATLVRLASTHQRNVGLQIPAGLLRRTVFFIERVA